jgi:predicted CoA-binding protein
MSNKTTVVIGASDNPERYAYKASMSLINKGYLVYAEGQRSGMINDVIPISVERKPYKDIDTVTLYVGAKNQPNWYEYILSLKPKRIIFNPGTENEELMQLAHDNHIETIEACTLVMLSIDNY